MERAINFYTSFFEKSPIKNDSIYSVFRGYSLTLRFLDVAVLRENGCLAPVLPPEGTGLP